MNSSAVPNSDGFASRTLRQWHKTRASCALDLFLAVRSLPEFLSYFNFPSMEAQLLQAQPGIGSDSRVGVLPAVSSASYSL